MDFHKHFPFGTLSERDRLDMRIDHRPLMCPVAAHFVTSVYMTAFHAICPNDILVHGCEHGLHIASVEAVVNVLKEVHFVRHSDLLRHGPRWRKPIFPHLTLLGSPICVSLILEPFSARHVNHTRRGSRLDNYGLASVS